MYRIPDKSNSPEFYVNKIINDDALNALSKLPSECVALAVTSPPYWNVVDYGIRGQIGQTSYEEYLSDLLPIWKETERVLIPNGKLAIITPIMPIPKKIINDSHTRHLKNINNDIESSILQNIPQLQRFSLYIWQKQTSVKMFGSYPYPPNIYEDNTIEFINVFVKEGAPPSIPKEAKEPSELTQEEWRNLTMQVWPIYPEDVQRAGGASGALPRSTSAKVDHDVHVQRMRRRRLRGRHRSGYVQWHRGYVCGSEGAGAQVDRYRPSPRLL